MPPRVKRLAAGNDVRKPTRRQSEFVAHSQIQPIYAQGSVGTGPKNRTESGWAHLAIDHGE